MQFFKALIPGFLLTFVVAGILGSNHQKGSFLYIFPVLISHHTFYWSWPLFIVATGVSWAIMAMTPD